MMFIVKATAVLLAATLAAMGEVAVAEPRFDVSSISLSPSPTLAVNRRLKIRLPSGMKLEESNANWYMATRDVERYELSVPETGERLVLTTFDTFSLAGKNFAAEVMVDAKSLEDKLKLKRPTRLRASSLVVYELLPTVTQRRSVTTAGLSLIYAAYVENLDGTIQILTFHLDSKSRADIGTWVRLARQVCVSLTSGSVSVPASEIEAFMGIGSNRIGISLPPKWTIRYLSLTDGFVYRLRKLDKLSIGAVGCDIVADPTHYDTDVTPPDATEQNGTVNGKRVVWHLWSADGKTLMRGNVPGLFGSFDASIVCFGVDEQGMKAALAVLATIKPAPIP